MAKAAKPLPHMPILKIRWSSEGSTKEQTSRLCASGRFLFLGKTKPPRSHKEDKEKNRERSSF